MANQNKYQNGKIYQITDIGYNKCYIGSTTEELSQRMARHRTDYKRFLNGSKKGHVRSYDLFNEYGIENCKIELLEYYKCDTLQELKRKEGEHIKSIDCVNRFVAGRTQQERYEDNKDKIKEYREQNKDKITEQKQLYRELNKDKIKEQRREYYQDNKEKVKERVKKYIEQYRDIINERRRAAYKLKKETCDKS